MRYARELRADFTRWVKAGNDPNDYTKQLPPHEAQRFDEWWEFWARDDQLPPEHDWLTWLMLGGRGAGKTRAGAEWVHGVAMGEAPFADRPVKRIALVGETFADVREVMIEGASGLLSVYQESRPRWEPGRRRLVWPRTGAIAHAFSAEDPESLRGPQFGAAWSDTALPAPIGEWSGWIISAIFLSESGERITRTIMRRRGEGAYSAPIHLARLMWRP